MTAKRGEPEMVASIFGVTLPDDNATTPIHTSTAVAVSSVREPIDLDAHPSIRAALDRNTGDRSKDQFRIIGACADAGVTSLPQIRAVIDQRPDLVRRLADRKDDDVATCLEKVLASRWWVMRDDGSAAKHSGQVRMAYALAESYIDRLLHVHGIGWFYWEGMRWALDDTGRAQRAVLVVLKEQLAASLGDKMLRRDVQRCESATGIAGVLAVAAALPQFAASVRELDADPYLLNHAAGTLDLQTLETRPHSPADRITKVCRGALQGRRQRADLGGVPGPRATGHRRARVPAALRGNRVTRRRPRTQIGHRDWCRRERQNVLRRGNPQHPWRLRDHGRTGSVDAS